MPKEGFKDRIYWVEQETEEEKEKRECEEAEQKRVERECSTYGPMGRYYPGLSESVWAKKDAEKEALERRNQIRAVEEKEAI